MFTKVFISKHSITGKDTVMIISNLKPAGFHAAKIFCFQIFQFQKINSFDFIQPENYKLLQVKLNFRCAWNIIVACDLFCWYQILSLDTQLNWQCIYNE